MFLTARVELHKTVLTVDVELATWWKSWSFITVWQMYAKTLNSTPLHQCVKSESFVRFIHPLLTRETCWHDNIYGKSYTLTVLSPYRVVMTFYAQGGTKLKILMLCARLKLNCIRHSRLSGFTASVVWPTAYGQYSQHKRMSSLRERHVTPRAFQHNVNNVLLKLQDNAVCITPLSLTQLGPENTNDLFWVCELCK